MTDKEFFKKLSGKTIKASIFVGHLYDIHKIISANTKSQPITIQNLKNNIYYIKTKSTDYTLDLDKISGSCFTQNDNLEYIAIELLDNNFSFIMDFREDRDYVAKLLSQPDVKKFTRKKFSCEINENGKIIQSDVSKLELEDFSKDEIWKALFYIFCSFDWKICSHNVWIETSDNLNITILNSVEVRLFDRLCRDHCKNNKRYSILIGPKNYSSSFECYFKKDELKLISIEKLKEVYETPDTVVLKISDYRIRLEIYHFKTILMETLVAQKLNLIPDIKRYIKEVK